MLHSRRSAQSSVLALALAATLALPAGAAASNSSIAVKGPSSIKTGRAYSFTVSGTAYTPGNFVSLRSATVPCASTYRAEYPLSVSTNSSRYVKNSQRFSFTVRLQAARPVTSYLCAYVINSRTIKTYAHAGTRLTVHGV